MSSTAPSIPSAEDVAEKAQVKDGLIPTPPDPMSLARSMGLAGSHNADNTNIKSLVESLVEMGRRNESVIEAIAAAYKAGDKEKVFKLAEKLTG